MLRPKKMAKVRLIVLKSKVGSLIKDLHEAGIVDIRKSDYQGMDEGRPLPAFDEVSSELLRLRSAIAIMEPLLGKKDAPEGEGLMPGAKAMEESKGFAAPERLKDMNNEYTAQAERLKALDSGIALAKKLSHFKNVDFKGLATRTMAFKAGEVQPTKMQPLREALNKVEESTMASEPGSAVTLVLFARESQPEVEAALGEAGFSELSMPEGFTTPAESLKRMSAERELLLETQKKLRAGMTAYSKDNVAKARTLLRSLLVESDRAEIASRFPQTKFLCVIEGWMMEEERKALDAIAHKYGASMVSEEIRFGHDEMPPTVLDNPKVAGPIEYITNSYSLPNYYEIDPTMVYLVALPIIYGMIVGDVIYGVMSIAIGYLLLQKFKNSYLMSNVSKIWMYSGVPSILFGFYFDEFGGMTHFQLAEFIGKWTGLHLLEAPLWTGFHRMEGVLALVALSALVGVIHMTLGYIFGAINEWNHDRKHSYAKIAWIGVEAGLILALLPYMPMLLPELGTIDPGLTTPGISILVLSVIVIAVTEGFIGIIEIPGLVGNILSYSRIAAIGVVGVVIAELVNEFIIPTPDKGLLIALVLLPIFIMLHLVNCFVAMFESIIQSGRLNIVEFKSKFMHGGGGVFVPFALYSKKL